MKARVSNLAKTEAEWARFNFKPLAGELIVYAPDSVFSYARIKIGDGEHFLHELPFVVESIARAITAEYELPEAIDAGRITEYIK